MPAPDFIKFNNGMVRPGRIELPAFPMSRERSTTELRAQIYYSNNLSIFAAMIKSFSERPPMACVDRFNITRLYKIAKSG